MRGTRTRFYGLALLAGLCAFFVVSITLVFGRTTLTSRAPIEYAWYQAPVILCHEWLGFLPSLLFFAGVGLWSGMAYFREESPRFGGKVVGVSILSVSLAGLLDLVFPIAEKTDPFFSKGGELGARIGMGLESQVGHLGATVLLGAAALLAIYFALGSPGVGVSAPGRREDDHGAGPGDVAGGLRAAAAGETTVSREESVALEVAATPVESEEGRGRRDPAPRDGDRSVPGTAPAGATDAGDVTAEEEEEDADEDRSDPDPQSPVAAHAENEPPDPDDAHRVRERDGAGASDDTGASDDESDSSEAQVVDLRVRGEGPASPPSPEREPPSPPGVLNLDFEELEREAQTESRARPGESARAEEGETAPRREDWKRRPDPTPPAPEGATPADSRSSVRSAPLDRDRGHEENRPSAAVPRREDQDAPAPGGSERGREASPETRPTRGPSREYQQAVRVVRESGRASEILLQRRLGIGYVEATRLLDQMEERGVVSPPGPSGFREVRPSGSDGDATGR